VEYDPARIVDPKKDIILYEGEPVRAEKRVVLLLNKPRGYLTTLRRQGNRPIVLDLFKEVKERVFPIGRLDFDTEGLLLMTNDGDLSYRLTHPKFQVEKVYEVWVDGQIKDGSDLARLRKGILLEDGLARVKRATVMKRAGDLTLVQVTLTEGKKREVKRMFQKIGTPVLKLKRVKFGGLGLGGLAPGSYRVLTPKEINTLEKSGAPKKEKNSKNHKK
jgi:pseudouridine synthase